MDDSESYRVFLDGNMWCAVGPGFRDLQQDEAAFAADPVTALAELIHIIGVRA